MKLNPTIALLFTTAYALLPTTEDRFISGDNDCFKVSSIQKAPSDFTYESTSLISSFASTSKTLKSATYQNSSTTVLNLIPGLSLLQTDAGNECYFVNTTIGTVEYPLIIDTGSAYLWVYGSDCDDTACESEALYTATESQSATSTFALAYVTGSASGTVVEDNIIVNKLATTQKFKFGKASTVPDFFSDYPVSGIFGLPSNDSSSIESIISALYESNAIGVKRFSISIGELNENDSDNYPNAGIFAIGEPIEELYKGDIYYTDLISNSGHYWLVAINQVLLADHQVQFTSGVEVDSVNSTTARTAIVDSGTTVLALPKQDALDIHSYFENSVTDGSNYAIYCNSTLDITLDINGKNWTIGPDQYLGDEYSESSGYGGYCVSNIQGVDSSADESWILGAVFLKTVYADFNVEDQQIGFAERNTDVILTSTATSASKTGTSEVTTVAYYGNSTVASSASSESSSASSSSYKDAANTLKEASLFTLLASFITLVLL